MDSSTSRKSNKIRDIVRLQQIIKKWKKLASNSKSMKKTAVPKGYVAVCVGKELKRFVIRTEYLSHQAFGMLLREAEEEFGFQQQGVLKFPCEVELFHTILKMMEDDLMLTNCNSPDSDLAPSHHHPPQMCR